jgi:hypothetical protein
MTTNSAYNAQSHQLGAPIDLSGPQCPMCRRPPADPVRLHCGHVYCNLCLIDIHLTAELSVGIALCKACGFVLAQYQQPSHSGRSHTVTTVGELVAEAQANPKGFHEWVCSSAIFQQKPQSIMVQQQAWDVQHHHLEQASEVSGAYTAPQTGHQIAGPLAQRRLLKGALTPPRLPMSEEQPLPRTLLQSSNIPQIAVAGNNFPNNALSQSFFNPPINHAYHYQGFGQQQLVERAPSMTSASNLYLGGLRDERLSDSTLETPRDATPKNLTVMKGRWKGRQKGVKQELE